MGVKTVLLLLALAICGTWGTTDDAHTTANLIVEQLAKFKDLQKNIANEKLNVTVLFSQTRFDEDNDFVQFDSAGFQPLLGKGHTKKLDVLEPLDEKSIELLFAFADRFNFTAVVSQEKFAADGTILSKYIYNGDMTIFYDNGNSNMVFKDRAVDQSEDIDVSGLLTLLKDYEIPAKTFKVLHNEEGEVVEADYMEHTPKKVKILEAKTMEIDQQMKVSEALKRTVVMKEDPVDRITLLCKYLGIQYPGTNWEAVIGSGHHYIKEDQLVKLLLDGEIYTIYTPAVDSEATEEIEED